MFRSISRGCAPQPKVLQIAGVARLLLQRRWFFTTNRLSCTKLPECSNNKVPSQTNPPSSKINIPRTDTVVEPNRIKLPNVGLVKKPLPIGKSTLANIIGGGCAYVDKTKFVYQLTAMGGQYYFLARPRRFGKSLMLDTLKQAFLGNKELFTGLYLEHNWDWSKKYPVIHLDFAVGDFRGNGLSTRLEELLRIHAKEYGIKLTCTSITGKFDELITEIYNKHGQQVVLVIDEYDKPLLDNITKPDILAVRDTLRSFYGVIKVHDAKLRFVFVTGISKFGRVSIFSELNQLEDISLSREYADICGYTQAELECTFVPYLQDVDLGKLRTWYNGYNFAGSDEQKVYNPFDILLFFKQGNQYNNYWFETGTPSFLVELIRDKKYIVPNLEGITVSRTALSVPDMQNISIIPLLFQTGYLTIQELTTFGGQIAYKLTYPNLEVQSAFNQSLLTLSGNDTIITSKLQTILQCLSENSTEKLKDVFNEHFASIPDNWYCKNSMPYYSSVIYGYLCSLEYPLITKWCNNKTGDIDFIVQLPDKILIFGVSVNKDVNKILQQIKDKCYEAEYKQKKKPIYIISINLSSRHSYITSIVSKCIYNEVALFDTPFRVYVTVIATMWVNQLVNNIPGVEHSRTALDEFHKIELRKMGIDLTENLIDLNQHISNLTQSPYFSKSKLQDLYDKSPKCTVDELLGCTNTMSKLVAIAVFLSLLTIMTTGYKMVDRDNMYNAYGYFKELMKNYTG